MKSTSRLRRTSPARVSRGSGQLPRVASYRTVAAARSRPNQTLTTFRGSQKRRSRSGQWGDSQRMNNSLIAATTPVQLKAPPFDRDGTSSCAAESLSHHSGLTQSAPDLLDLGSNSGDSGIELGREHLCGRCGRDMMQTGPATAGAAREDGGLWMGGTLLNTTNNTATIMAVSPT